VRAALDVPAGGVKQVRPRMRNVGIAHGIAAGVLLAVLAFSSLVGCSGVPVRPIPAGIGLSLLVATASVAMVARIPRMTAIAPALALGASLPLLSGAVFGWVWLSRQGCMTSTQNRELAAMLLVAAATIAVLVTSLWLLVSRDEIEPWFGARGVALSSAAALTVLGLALGYAAVLHDGGRTAFATLAVAGPWAVAVAGTGWLRPSPAIALAAPALTQVAWLLVA
jgi:hypothetical protein